MEKENALGAIVIGQSLGAVIASKLTFSAGRRISKIIMIGPFSKGLVKRQWFWENLATATNAVVSEPKSTKPVQDYADLFNSSMIKHPYTDLKGTPSHICSSDQGLAKPQHRLASYQEAMHSDYRDKGLACI